MKQYKVYKHPSGLTEAIKQGWSWPGFFFGCFWAMKNKMWGLGVGVLIGFIVLVFIIGTVAGGSGGEALISVVSMITNVFFGVNGNSWREKNLASRGFDLVDTTTTANPAGATARHQNDVNAERSPILYYVDLLVRIVAGVSLIPLALMVLFLSIMTDGASRSGSIMGFLIIGIGYCLIWFLYMSCVNPDILALKCERYLGRARWIVRAPPYLYAPLGLYYGKQFLSGIMVNLIR
jgi:hypothetical protein